MVGTAMMVILGLAVAWALGSIMLRALAWIFMGAALISTVASIPVPGAAAATALVCWLLGHFVPSQVRVLEEPAAGCGTALTQPTTRPVHDASPTDRREL